jgi:hypothetical protein
MRERADRINATLHISNGHGPESRRGTCVTVRVGVDASAFGDQLVGEG